MAYIGREPLYGAFEKQSLTADSSTTTFALTYAVGSSSSIIVSVAGVVQEPETGYNLTGGGTSIVFSAAPTTGDTIFVVYLGVARDALQATSGMITSQTELSGTPASNDLFLVYDTSASSLKKISLQSVNRTATGDGSTTGFTVTSGVTAAQCLVTVNGVVQQVTTDYSVSGTTLTFGTAPAASDRIQIRELPR